MSTIVEQCRAQGMRLTGQRKLIADAISAASDHPDAFELHRRISEQHRGVSIATVYRTLKRLKEVGILEQHSFSDSRNRYEDASKKHHDHLIDVGTGEVVEFNSPEIERLQERIAKEKGYRLVGHRLTLYAERN